MGAEAESILRLESSGRSGVPRRLVVRLSSLGDVILASAALEAIRRRDPQSGVDWVVCREYAELLKGHPGIRRVWEYDRRTGLRGWLRLGRELKREGYFEVFDLHGSLRSRLLRVLFLMPLRRAAADSNRIVLGWPGCRWRRVSKQRLRLWGYFALKQRWPRRWRPKPFVERFARAAGGGGGERPDLRHLIAATELPRELVGRRYLCVMPGSRWAGKKWPVSSFLSALTDLPFLLTREISVAVLGSQADPESFELARQLESRGIDVISGAGLWTLSQTARALSSSLGYFGSDTGLAHLAEAVGKPAAMVLGPTVPDMGFGPWRPDSLALGMELGCRPCSKDGRKCFRRRDLYLCMTGLEPGGVGAQLRPWVDRLRQSRDS